VGGASNNRGVRKKGNPNPAETNEKAKNEQKIGKLNEETPANLKVCFISQRNT